MISLSENALAANTDRVHRMQSLIIGRLMIIFLLLVTSWLWHSGTFQLTYDSFPQGLFLVFIISVGLTIVYFFLLRISKQLAWQIRAQFLLDSLLITWLVWRTGDLTSPYITLYIVLISVASLFLRPLSTILMAVTCVALFFVLAVLTSNSIVSSSGPPQSASKVVQIVSFHVVAFLVVGLLAARLSERRASGAELEQTTRSLASLRALHERIVESIRSGLITTDLEGNIVSFNAAAAEITGYTAGQVTGKPIAAIFGDISEPTALSLDAVETGEHVPRFEGDLRTPEGFVVRIGYGITRLFSETSEASGFIITFQDLTDIRSMEENIRRKDRMAAVGRVAAGLAHEIRNPLGAMRGAIQVLESKTERGSSNAELMDIILKESDRLNSIITNFLSYARPPATQILETDVAGVIRDTFKLLRHSPDVSDSHVLTDESGEKSVTISADASQLKQIFWNLARNAIQAMPEGGTLTVGLEELPNGRVRIKFEDTGHGMSPDQVEQLFEPFANSTSGGTGLGLSIVYQIVRDHNGTINVRSREGKGTLITIDLPRERRPPTSENGTPDKESAAPIERLLRINP